MMKIKNDTVYYNNRIIVYSNRIKVSLVVVVVVVVPSKFLLEVAAHRCSGNSLSGFMARHMEQPGSLQSNPASLNITSKPSASA